MQALKVQWKLASPLFIDSEYPIHLDALLAKACVMEMEAEGVDDAWSKTDSYMEGMLAKTDGDAWVWKASKLMIKAASSIQLTNQIRKSDPDMYYADLHSPENPSGVWVTGFMKDGSPRKFNSETLMINTASGQQRGYQWLSASQWVAEITAYAVGDIDAVQYYLSKYIKHIGKVSRNGYGRIDSMVVTPHDSEDDWRMRVLPLGEPGKPGCTYAPVQACLRDPYWRKTDRVKAMEFVK